jgi:hypothetical protein
MQSQEQPKSENPYFIHEMNGNSSSFIFSNFFEVYNLRPRFSVQKEGERKQDGNMKQINEHHP